MKTTPRAGPAVRPSGQRVVAVMLALGLALAAFALVFQWRQTDDCLRFYGGDVARAITSAPHVELWHLAPGPRPGGLIVVGRCDVSRAPGLVHLRRGLVEDANFAGRARDPQPRPAAAWNVALAFAAAPGAPPSAVVAVGFAGGGGEACVVGRPGRVVLGRLEKGLRTWVEATCPRAPSGPDGRP